MISFSELGLAEPVCRAVANEGYSIPTPIQEQAIPLVLAGRDILGIAQTGTGKTAAFALPILHLLAANNLRPSSKSVRALVLVPTRELAIQNHDSFVSYSRFQSIRHAVLFGGVGMGPQIRACAAGNDVIIATPGRLLDLINRGYLSLSAVEFLVFDEADRMLDMGFIHDVRKIVSMMPKRRQTLFFSATMPTSVIDLANSILHQPERVEVTPQATTVERIHQRVMFVAKDDKRRLLVDLLRDRSVSRAIVFARTKHGANRLAEQLVRQGVTAEAIHGNKSQGARQRALADFQSGRVSTLVATDIAARGIDVDGISHVINYELPNEPESYVHRIGRTARAGAEGIAVSFCDLEELAYLKAIEKIIHQEVPVDETHAYHSEDIAQRRFGPLPKPPKRNSRSSPSPRHERNAAPVEKEARGRFHQNRRRRPGNRVQSAVA